MDYQRARKTSEKDERRKSILDASKKLFASQGLSGTSIDQISGDCHLSRSLIYTYYLDKKHILIAIVCEALDLLQREFEAQVLQMRNGLEAIASVGGAYVRFARSKPEYYDAVLRFKLQDGPSFLEPDGKKDALIESFNDDLRGLIARAKAIDDLMVAQIERGMQDGSIRVVPNPAHVARALWAMVAGLIQASSGDDEWVQTGLELAKAGLRKGGNP